METRSFVYNGESVVVETIYDGVRVTAGEGEGEYLVGNGLYQVPEKVASIRIEHLEFIRDKVCPGGYCLTNAAEISQELVVCSREVPVRVPFVVTERMCGNYLQVQVRADKGLGLGRKGRSVVREDVVVSINGHRMSRGKKRYMLRISELDHFNSILWVSVSYGQIQYTKEAKIKLPLDFMYTIGTKRLGDKRFVRLCLFKATNLSQYEVELLNPLGEKAGYGRTGSLGVRAPEKKFTVQDLDCCTELFFEVIKLQDRARFWFAAEINGVKIELPLKW
ncbi:hypothetical protein NEHOM01_1841 [Nematocida homosporus]|uniref:uncharacterized protein n=1 Tax=Nematocida homosporus TaxID=1912981 RepID=UPI00221FC2C2|nr:uncharacterized protein NEHOM01_1841 [Nematocida homosporus]KAI5186983.1 hypothetical protein NEHOM01_1841 [Nematocida homosporus]